MRACREDLMTLVLGFLKYNVMAGEPEMYKCIYLGLIERVRVGFRESIEWIYRDLLRSFRETLL